MEKQAIMQRVTRNKINRGLIHGFIKKHGGAESIDGIVQFSELSPDSAPLVISYFFTNIIWVIMNSNQLIFQYFGIFLTKIKI